jgi:hypothetical protein
MRETNKKTNATFGVAAKALHRYLYHGCSYISVIQMSVMDLKKCGKQMKTKQLAIQHNIRVNTVPGFLSNRPN